METGKQDSGREAMSSSGRVISREEYEVLMSELAQKTVSDQATPISEVDAKLKKLEFNMMILTALILVVFILCRTG